ncbi:MAG: hypothetical protein ACLVJH_08370 [Faecalibacterium prausnitzii]
MTGQLDEKRQAICLPCGAQPGASYVQEILRNAEDLERLSVMQITAVFTQQLLKSGDISLDTLDTSSEQERRFAGTPGPAASGSLLRTKRGDWAIFLILNTHDLDTCEVGKKCPASTLRMCTRRPLLWSATATFCWNAPAPQW